MITTARNKWESQYRGHSTTDTYPGVRDDEELDILDRYLAFNEQQSND
jgi:hypothetical protein